MTELYPLTGKRYDWIHRIAPFQFGSILAINSRLRFLSAPSAPHQMDPAAAPIYKPFSQTQPTVYIAASINMNVLLTVRKSERPLQRNGNRPDVNIVARLSFFNTRIPFLELPQYMPNIHHLLEGLGSGNKYQTNVDKLKQIVRGFGCFMKVEPASSHQGAAILSTSFHQRVEVKRLRNQLDSKQSVCHQLRHQFLIACDMFTSNE